MFDDAAATEYTEGFAYMNSLGLKGTIYVPTAYIGQAGFCSWVQLQAMDTAGWSVANHSRNHVSFSTLTQAQIEAELTGAETDLTANGLATAAKHVAYPYGIYNAATLAAMTATGMLTGVTTDDQYHTAGEDLYTIGRDDFNAFTVGWIIGANADQICCILFHGIATAPTVAEFKSFIDWLVVMEFNFLTIEDINGLG